ncbi:MAG TPA: tetratricopeptide repeat protein [Vicinamibacterales bacterium]|nr:tetratricopeptide repeat protein [Vicinamibacterales bacterium]
MTAAFAALLVNSAYLAASASPTLFYFANIVLHIALGIALSIAAARYVGPRLRSLNAGSALAWLLLAAGAISGAVLTVVGATTPNASLLHTHIATTTAGSALLAVFVLWPALRTATPRVRATAGVAAMGVMLAAAVSAAIAVRADEHRRRQFRIVNPDVVPTKMEQEGAGPAGPFFPSSANTTVNGTIPANFFLTSASCGRCHKDIYDQWNSSAHHFSSFNNQWYRKSIEYMQDVVGTKPSKWCAGCHDHAVFFNGRFDRPIREQIDTPEAQAGLGCTSCHAITRVNSTMGQGDFVVEYPPLHDLAASESPVLRSVHDWLLYLDPKPHRETFLKPFHSEQTPEFCASCHKVHLDVPVNAYRWFRGFNDYDNWQASGVSGEGARSFYYPPKPQKCADCHMPLVKANDPAATDGMVRSHRFAAANTALPFVNGDREQLEAVQTFLRDGQISVDIFGIVRADHEDTNARSNHEGTKTRSDHEDTTTKTRRHEETTGLPASEPQIASTFAVGEESMNFGATGGVIRPAAEVIGPLGRVEPSVRRGESVRVEVVVRTRKVGHFFPGGTVDAFDVWVELEATDDRGRTLLHSGRVEDGGKGSVEPGAHFYRSLLLDAHGNQINKRNAWAARSVAYVRLIPPGAADTLHYRLQIPKDAGSTIHLKAKVNYRKFAWWNTQWAFAGVRDPNQPDYAVSPHFDDGKWVFRGDTNRVSGSMKRIPDIPTTVMAEAAATLKVIGAEEAKPAEAAFTHASVRERWNDYGIGLLLQGDLKGAEAAFEKVAAMDPAYADGWVNIGRARLQEGNLAGAETVLRRALAIDPKLAKTHFFLGVTLKNDGRYDEALGHLQTAAGLYPRDRVVLNQLGRVLFLKRQFKDAVVQFARVLKIDPEDLQAHYNLMLCYQGLGDEAAAARERTLYERFKADESAQAITGPYRQLHPDDNNERQAIHEHGHTAGPSTALRAGGGR